MNVSGPAFIDVGEKLRSFLASLQLADSFFPSGFYALSHGIESFAQAGLVDPSSLEALLADYLHHGIGPSDGVALACSHRAVDTEDLALVAAADLRLTAVKLSREARESSQRTGRQLLATARAVFGGDLLSAYAGRVRAGAAPGNHAVALGLAMAELRIPLVQAIAGELYAFASSAVAAAVRLAAIDHRTAQVVLHRLAPAIVETAGRSQNGTVADIGGCTPLIDIMAMRHEAAELRLFVS